MSAVRRLTLVFTAWAVCSCSAQDTAPAPTVRAAATVSASLAPAPTRQPSRPARLDTASVLDTLRQLIRRDSLTSLQPACFTFVDAPDEPPLSYEVRERHNGSCGGDPQTAPRLFSIRYDPATGTVLSDAGVVERGGVGMDTVRAATRVGRIP